MATCLIGIGSNLGDRQKSLSVAISKLESHAEISLVAKSRFYSSAPAGGPTDQNEFLNGAILVETSLSPEKMFNFFFSVEDELNRERTVRWGPRTIDLDLLTYDDVVCVSSTLTLPHPRMSFRRFVLEPACEIAPDMVHPILQCSLRTLLDHLDAASNYVAIAGVSGARKSRIANMVSAQTQAVQIADPDRVSPLDVRLQPTVRSADVLLELLRSHVAVLRNVPGKQSSISHFWLNELFVLARCWLRDDELKVFTDAWQQLSASVMPPKLVVLLEDDEETPQRAKLLHDYVFDQYHLPLLHLRETTDEDAVAEIFAAFEAMK